MLKHVALLKVDIPQRWYQWHFGSTATYYKSPIFDNKKDAENWITSELDKYPDARINCNISDRKYLIHSTIISFDVEESSNVEMFLKELFI